MRRPACTYADAGVNLAAWNRAKERIGEFVRSTYNSCVRGGFGHFGGLFSIAALKELKKPVLVSSVDGVGTKLKIAVAVAVHDTVGEDIVNHCINDILVLGARPLFFLDYIATGKLIPEVTEKIIEGIARACKRNNCVLIGGETAEMPGVYNGNDYDLVGTIVGVVDEDKIIDGSRIIPGDMIVGLRSSGLHTNGYSLARKIITEIAGCSYDDIFPETGRTFGQELLRPHRCYLTLLPLMEQGFIKGCAHLTGGGFQENINRILPTNCDAVIQTKVWVPDPIFRFLQEKGGVDTDEMYRTFNMGIGMVLVVDKSLVVEIQRREEIAHFEPLVIGTIEAGNGNVKMMYSEAQSMQ